MVPKCFPSVRVGGWDLETPSSPALLPVVPLLQLLHPLASAVLRELPPLPCGCGSDCQIPIRSPVELLFCFWKPEPCASSTSSRTHFQGCEEPCIISQKMNSRLKAVTGIRGLRMSHGASPRWIVNMVHFKN